VLQVSGVGVDISFDATSGLVTRALISDLLRRYPPVRPLVIVLKYFLIQVCC
jgi:DNA polymerase sigma